MILSHMRTDYKKNLSEKDKCFFWEVMKIAYIIDFVEFLDCSKNYLYMRKRVNVFNASLFFLLLPKSSSILLFQVYLPSQMLPLVLRLYLPQLLIQLIDELILLELQILLVLLCLIVDVL